MTTKKMFLLNRPEGFKGQIELALPVRIEKLYKLLNKTISSFSNKTLFLNQESLKELSIILIEFAEDLYCGFGFWTAFENYNKQFFGTPLPIVMSQNDEIENTYSPKRILFLLQHLYEIMKPEIIISHSHKDIIELSNTISDFLTDSFTNLSQISGIGKLLATPNKEAGDVKRKLIWLGTRSYLFRLSFISFSYEFSDSADEIGIIDDFICAESTSLSGLGVIDILAGCLPITEEEQADLRSWYERHYALFQVLDSTDNHITVLNLINNQKYTVITNEDTHVFRAEKLILGSLIPWRGDWYWSGTQHFLPIKARKEVLRDFYKQPRIIYRYSKDILAKSIEGNRKQFESFIDFYKSELAIFPDGRKMADSENARNNLIFKNKLSREQQKAIISKHNAKGGSAPQLNFPAHILSISDGVALFYNAEEGIEIALHYNTIKNALLKKGKGLTQDETSSILGLMESDVISPSFVKRIIEEYSRESILKIFMIQNNNTHAIDYLLRKYKGQFFRNRYPTITTITPLE